MGTSTTNRLADRCSLVPADSSYALRCIVSPSLPLATCCCMSHPFSSNFQASAYACILPSSSTPPTLIGSCHRSADRPLSYPFSAGLGFSMRLSRPFVVTVPLATFRTLAAPIQCTTQLQQLRWLRARVTTRLLPYSRHAVTL